MRIGKFLCILAVFPDLDMSLLKYSQLAVVLARISVVNRGQVPFEKMLIRDEV